VLHPFVFHFEGMHSERRFFMTSRFGLSGRLAAAAALSMLLTTSAAFAQAKTVGVRGSFDGHGVGVIQGGTLHASGGGAGTASRIGRFSYVLNATVNMGNASSTGVFVLVFSNGDVIHGSFAGQGGPPNATDGRIVETLTILGGTGRFEGATGSLTLDRILDESTLPPFESHSGTLTGTMKTIK
jgi:hypothetical protein